MNPIERNLFILIELLVLPNEPHLGSFFQIKGRSWSESLFRSVVSTYAASSVRAPGHECDLRFRLRVAALFHLASRIPGSVLGSCSPCTNLERRASAASTDAAANPAGL